MKLLLLTFVAGGVAAFILFTAYFQSSMETYQENVNQISDTLEVMRGPQ